MKMRATIVIEYNVPDDPEVRRAAYGTADPDEMAALDARNNPFDFVALCDDVDGDVQFTVVPIQEAR